MQSSTQISAVVPPINTETPQTIYNVTVTTGSGVSAKATANQWYWFGAGTCTFSGTGVVNSGAPPGASAYIQGAVAGTSPNNPSGGTSIPSACTGLVGLGTTAPMIESLGAPTAGIVTGTGPGGNGGNEEWLGWSGKNNYFATSGSTYNAPNPGFNLPASGPSTSGGCPITTALCNAAGQPVYYGTDPNATCPPSQAQTDAGLVDCSVGLLTAATTSSSPSTYIAATLQISYANDPTPDPATATFSPGTVAPGQTVTLNTCGSCNWWGAGSQGAPSFVDPIGPTGTAVAVPAPAVWVGTTRSSAVEASMATDTLAVTPAGYDCGSTGGASETSPGPTATCTLTQGTISGSFVMPSVSCSPCHVYVDEPNLSLTQSTYAADGGTGTYNNGLSYQLVNSVESNTLISCPTCGTGGTAPTVTGVSPTNGPAAGGTQVTVSGTNLTGATAVHFGSTAGTSISNVTAGSLQVTAPAGTGTVDVTVTTPDGTSPVNSPADNYTYNAASPPTVTGVSPTNGPAAGGTLVTVSGTNLTGATAVHFGSTLGTGISNVTAGSLQVTAPAGTGTVDVTVTTPNGTSAVNSPADNYTYNAPALPTVTGLSPTNGPAAGGTQVTVSGTNLTGATAVHFGSTLGTGLSNVTAGSLTITSPAGTGTVDVTVTTPNGTSAVNSPADSFTFNPAPTVTGVSPNNGPEAGGNTVTVNGSNFTGTPTVDFGSTPGTEVANVTSGSLTVVVPAGTGTVSVTVSTTAGGASTPLPSAYTYNPPPTVTGLSPTNGPAGGGTQVTVSGTNLTGATAVDFGSTPGTGLSNVTAGSLTVTAPAGTGAVDVTVTTPNGTSPVNSPADNYTYNPPPTVTGVSPTNGPAAGGTQVTVSGTNLTGATAVDFGSTSGTNISNVTAGSLTVTAPAGSGTVDVTVTTPNGTSPVNSPADEYTYNGPPTVSGVVPNNGPQAGGNTVTVNGSNFTGTPTVDFGSIPGTDVANVTSGSLTVTVPAGAGTVSVTVATAAGGASTPLPSAYTYNPPPTVTGLSPTNGPAAGGTQVTVNGTNLTGATAVDFGSTPGTGLSNVTSGSLTITAPAGSGTVDVTVTTPNGTSVINSPSDQFTYNPAPTVTGVSPNNGPEAGGNTVTVNGSNFTGASAVQFGSVAGSGITNVTSGSLQVTVPAGTGTVDVTVTTPNGTSPVNSPADEYTYNAPAQPTVTGLSPTNGPAAGGTQVTVSGTNLTGATAVDFGSTPGTEIGNITAGSLTVTAPAGSGTVDVTVTTPNGTSPLNLPADEYTYNPAPTVTGVSPNNGPEAGGNTVTVNGSNFTGTPTVDFGSTPGTNVANVTSGSFTVTVPAGTGTVSVTVSTTAGGASAPLPNAYTYNGSTTAGGTVSLSKVAALIGNYPDKVSGTGWGVNGDTKVTLNECATTSYSSATCDAANQVSVTLGTGHYAGTFKSFVIDVAVGRIDSNGDACGVAGSTTTCYIVVVGNTGDSTSSGALSFMLPTITLKKTTGVLGNYVDGVKAAGFPIGDTIVVQECDADVSVPSTVSTNCDAATQVSGVSGPTGKVTFNSTGVTLRVGSAYFDSADGICQVGGECTVGVTDSDNGALGAVEGVGFSSPIVSLKQTTNVLGNSVDAVKAAGFPIGDTVVAQECDPNVVVPTTIGSDCDAATQISGTAAANGKVTFSPVGVTLAVGSGYSDRSDGACPVGGTCTVVVSDAASPSIGLAVAVTFAVPTATLKESSDVSANYVDKVTAGEFPIGATVTAQECDPNVTSANLAMNCDGATQISGTVGSNGKVAFTAAGVMILVGSAYSDGAGGACSAGGSCNVVVSDSTHSGVSVVVPIGLAS